MNVVRGDAQAIELKGLTIMTSHETTMTTQAAAVAEPCATVAPERASSEKTSSQKKAAPKGQNSAKGGKAKATFAKKARPAKRAATSATTPKPAGEPKAPREGSKMAQVIAMISKKGGATLEAIQKETGWAKHTIRGFMSTLTRRTGVEFTSTRRESDKVRVYEAVR